MDAQLDAVRRTLAVAEVGIAGCSAVFTVFPEYAIPGVAGAALIDARVAGDSWPSDSVVIAGVDGLTRAQYEELCETLHAHVANLGTPDSIPNTHWVNCCVMWAKEHTGTVRRWVQPKIRPSWDETAVTCDAMFRGSSVFVFEGKYDLTGYPCRFTTLICADWVKKDNGSTVRDELLENLNTQWMNSQPDLDWVFVIQNNPKPNHTSFLTGTLEFLTDHSHAFVHRDDAIVFHVNTAASQFPARSGDRGFTACVLSPRAPVICTGSPPTVRTWKLDFRDDLQTCKDVVFREMGECIHAFTVRVPRSLGGVADDKTFAVPIAHVHATEETTDPRLCGGPVPASVKWTNDVLDELPLLADTLLVGRPLAPRAKGSEERVVEDLRKSGGHRIIEYIDWATCAISNGNKSRGDSRRKYADLWDESETGALEHLIHSLTCIGMAYPLDVAGASLHGSILTDKGDYIDVVAIRGDTHPDCCKHYHDNVAIRQRTDPVLVLARDRENHPIMAEELSTIMEPDGDGRAKFLGYCTLALSCRSAVDAAALRGELNDSLPETRRII